MSDPSLRWRCTAATAFILALAPAVAAAQVEPNILLVVLDDLGVDQVGAYGVGSNPPPTPNLDALAAGGVLFRSARSHANCTPTRAALLTGRHAFRTGMGAIIGDDPGDLTEPGLAASETILPELLDTVGTYAHAAFGKWHLSAAWEGPLAPNIAGFGHYDGSLTNLDIVLPAVWSYDSWPRVVDGVESVETQYLTSATVDSALAWIGATTEPWFAYVAFHAVHSPYHWPPQHLHSVDPGAVPQGQLAKWQHRAMVESLDAEVGRLVAGLGSAAANTTVIVVGDNGTAGPGVEAPLVPAKTKHTLYDGGIHVPLLVSGAGVRTVGECNALVQVLDLFATVADLAGVDPAAGGSGVVDAISLVPYLTDPAGPAIRDYAFSEQLGDNDPSKSVPTPAQLSPASPGLPPLCQADLGFGGPGPAHPALSLCGSNGQSPVKGNVVDLTLTGAPPGSASLLIVGSQVAPIRFLGGTLVPAPILALLPFVADGAGELHLSLPGEIFSGFDTQQLVAQSISIDVNLPQGNVLSNAIEVPVLPFDRKAIVDADGYKLIITAHGGKHELYNLAVDPYETNDLLSNGEPGLDPETAAHLGSLKSKLFALLATGASGP